MNSDKHYDFKKYMDHAILDVYVRIVREEYKSLNRMTLILRSNKINFLDEYRKCVKHKIEMAHILWSEMYYDEAFDIYFAYGD